MLRQSNEARAQATERLFLAVVNQAISDVLENGEEAKEAERWLLSKDFDALDSLFALSAKPVESPLQKGNKDVAPVVLLVGVGYSADWTRYQSNRKLIVVIIPPWY